MVSSLTTQEKTTLYSKMVTLIKAKSKLINDNVEFFTNDMLVISLDENLCYICDYIHRPDRYLLIQPTLHYIWADMCIDGLKARYNEESKDGGGSIATDDVIGEIKMANATVKFDTGSDTKTSSNSYVPSQVLLKEYNRRLQEYRRIF